MAELCSARTGEDTRPHTSRVSQRVQEAEQVFLFGSSQPTELFRHFARFSRRPEVPSHRAWGPEAQRPPASRRPLRCFPFCVLFVFCLAFSSACNYF